MTLLDDRIDARIAEIADVAGALNLANARLVRIMEAVLADDDWRGPGIHSPAQWLSYRAGVTITRAKAVIAVAERRADFPVVIGHFDAGELSLEQVAELVKAPAWADAKLIDWGLVATPHRIRRSIKMNFGPEDHTGPDEAADEPTSSPASDVDRVTTRITDDHRFEIHADLDLGSGDLVSAALMAARERLWGRGEREITDADCLIEVCEGFLDGITDPVRRDRAKTWVHLDAVTGRALTSTGVRMPDGVRDRLCCDGQIQPVWERDGVPFSVGRTQRIVPERTRRIVLLRDRTCRVPGCNSDRFLEIHHIVHWLDGGPTDTWNLAAICPRHHRLHHQGRVGITGNADELGGLTFTDERGRTLAACGRPAPPGELERPPNRYDPPLMGAVDWTYLGQSWRQPERTN